MTTGSGKGSTSRKLNEKSSRENVCLSGGGFEDRHSNVCYGLIPVLLPEPYNGLQLSEQFIRVHHHHPDGSGPPGADPSPAPDQPLGIEQGQFDLNLVEFSVWGRGVLEAEIDGFGGYGEPPGRRGGIERRQNLTCVFRRICLDFLPLKGGHKR